jgi:alkanesulfonate monooxygenase SsuD/methylene tetrahydromethanopterin reductase-like flavin-dependent oxidoreductase (luciferase family)
MRIGIGLPNQVRDVRPAVIPGWAATAEGAGFSSLGSVGRIAYPGVMDTVALAAAAGTTSRIELVSNVLLGTVWPAELLAKEVAGIDGVSAGRLTLGLGIGARPDDFVSEGLGLKDRGRRFDRDLQVYHNTWRGMPVGGGSNPAVPRGTREVPLLFGGVAPASFERMAKWGQGYVGASFSVEMVASAFDSARSAWREHGRDGEPRLVAIAYFAFSDIDAGRADVYDYYSNFGSDLASTLAAGVSGGAEAVKATVKAFEALGADDLILNPTVDDPDEVRLLADAVL